MDIELERYDLPLLFAGLLVAIAVIYVVSRKLGPSIALKGTYAVFGFLFAIFLRISFQWGSHLSQADPDVLLKLVVIVTALSLAAAIFVDPLISLFGLAVSFACLGLLLYQRSWTRCLAGLCLASTIAPLTRYLTTGIWYGSGDLFKHTVYIESVVSSGSIAEISRYAVFPGLHSLLGIIVQVTEIPAYDSLQIGGVAVYITLILITFVCVRAWTGKTILAVIATIIASQLPQISSAATYLYPQSLTVVLVFIALAATTLPKPNWRSVLAMLFALSAAIITHHLTFLLLLPVLIMASILSDRFNSHRRFTLVNSLIWGLSVFGYWLLFGNKFLREVVFVALSIFEGTATGSPSVFIIGTYSRTFSNTLPSEILTYGGLLMAVLVCCLCLAVVAQLHLPTLAQRSPVMVGLGILCAGLVLKLPFGIKGLGRFQHAISVFAAIGFSIGIFYLFHQRTNMAKRQTALILAILTVTSAVYVAPAIYLDDKEANAEHLPPGEAAQLEQIAEFGEYADKDMTTPWVTQEALNRYGESSTRPPEIDRTSIRIDGGLFVYRASWPDHKLPVRGDTLVFSQLFLSSNTLDSGIERNNRVYHSGETGILWNNTPYQIGENVTQ